MIQTIHNLSPDAQVFYDLGANDAYHMRPPGHSAVVDMPASPLAMWQQRHGSTQQAAIASALATNLHNRTEGLDYAMRPVLAKLSDMATAAWLAHLQQNHLADRSTWQRLVTNATAKHGPVAASALLVGLATDRLLRRAMAGVPAATLHHPALRAMLSARLQPAYQLWRQAATTAGLTPTPAAFRSALARARSQPKQYRRGRPVNINPWRYEDELLLFPASMREGQRWPMAQAFTGLLMQPKKRKYARGGEEEKGYHNDILNAEKYDVQPALRYAEWLEEQGMPTHAQVVRGSASTMNHSPVRYEYIPDASHVDHFYDQDRNKYYVGLLMRNLGFKPPGYGESFAFWCPVSHDPSHLESFIKNLAAEGAKIGPNPQHFLDTWRKPPRRRMARGGEEEKAHHDAMRLVSHHDMGPALRYADFLEEHGMPMHAAVIRGHVADQKTDRLFGYSYYGPLYHGIVYEVPDRYHDAFRVGFHMPAIKSEVKRGTGGFEFKMPVPYSHFDSTIRGLIAEGAHFSRPAQLARRYAKGGLGPAKREPVNYTWDIHSQSYKPAEPPTFNMDRLRVQGAPATALDTHLPAKVGINVTLKKAQAAEATNPRTGWAEPAKEALPNLWLVHGGLQGFHELVHNLPDHNILGNVAMGYGTDASGREHVLLKPLNNKDRLYLDEYLRGRGTPMSSYKQHGNMYLPNGSTLSVPVRPSLVREHMAPDNQRLYFYHATPEGGLRGQSLPMTAFRPVRDILQYASEPTRGFGAAAFGSPGLAPFAVQPGAPTPPVKGPVPRRRVDLRNIPTQDLLSMYAQMYKVNNRPYSNPRGDIKPGMRGGNTEDLRHLGLGNVKNAGIFVVQHRDRPPEVVIENDNGDVVQRRPLEEVRAQVQQGWRAHEDAAHERAYQEALAAYNQAQAAAPLPSAPVKPPRIRRPRATPPAPLPAAPAPVAPSAAPDHIEALRAAEAAFKGDPRPLEAKADSWLDLARLQAQAGNSHDASIGYANAMWHRPTIDAQTANEWAAHEGGQPDQLITNALRAPVDGTTGRQLAAGLVATAAQPGGKMPAATIQAAGRRLIEAEPYIGVKPTWLAVQALEKLAGSDPLAVARWRDHLLERLKQRGIDTPVDTPAFLRGGGGDKDISQAMHSRVDALGQHLHNWIDAATTLGTGGDNRVAQQSKDMTKAYADALLGIGQARLGDAAAGRRRFETAMHVLTGAGNTPSRVLAGVLQHRFNEAASGRHAAPLLPPEQQRMLAEAEAATQRAIVDHPAGTPERDNAGNEAAASNFFNRYLRFLHPEAGASTSSSYSGRSDNNISDVLTLPSLTNPGDIQQLANTVLGRNLGPEARLAALTEFLRYGHRAGEGFVVSMLQRAQDALEATAGRNGGDIPPQQARVLGAALGAANHYQRSGETQRLLGMLGRFINDYKDKALLDFLGALSTTAVAAASRAGHSAAVAAMYNQALAKVLAGREPASLGNPNDNGAARFPENFMALLPAAVGLMAAGHPTAAEPVMASLRQRLMAPSRDGINLMYQYGKAFDAYLEGLSYLPSNVAVPRLEELLIPHGNYAGLPALINPASPTQQYFSRGHMIAIDALVHHLLQRSLLHSPEVQRHLNEDDYLTRRRIHHDTRAAIGG